MSFDRKVDDRQATVSKPQTSFDLIPISAVVWSAMAECIGHGFQLAARFFLTRRRTQPKARDSTHYEATFSPRAATTSS